MANLSNILGIGVGAVTLGAVAYYLYKKNSNSEDTTEQAEETLFTDTGGGAVTTDTTTQATVLDVIKEVLGSTTTNTNSAESLEDVYGLVNGNNTDIENVPLMNTEYTQSVGYGTVDDNGIIAVNSDNPSDEKADVLTSGVDTMGTTDVENYYLNTYGITESQYNTLRNTGYYAKMSDDTFNSSIRDTKRLLESSTESFLVNENDPYVELYNDSLKYLTEAYDTSGAVTSYVKGTVQYQLDTASNKNKYSYTGNAATGSTTTYDDDEAYSVNKSAESINAVKSAISSGTAKTYTNSDGTTSSGTGTYNTHAH